MLSLPADELRRLKDRASKLSSTTIGQRSLGALVIGEILQRHRLSWDEVFDTAFAPCDPRSATADGA